LPSRTQEIALVFVKAKPAQRFPFSPTAKPSLPVRGWHGLSAADSAQVTGWLTSDAAMRERQFYAPARA